jgi:hypothetical protein
MWIPALTNFSPTYCYRVMDVYFPVVSFFDMHNATQERNKNQCVCLTTNFCDKIQR